MRRGTEQARILVDGGVKRRCRSAIFVLNERREKFGREAGGNRRDAGATYRTILIERSIVCRVAGCSLKTRAGVSIRALARTHHIVAIITAELGARNLRVSSGAQRALGIATTRSPFHRRRRDAVPHHNKRVKTERDGDRELKMAL